MTSEVRNVPPSDAVVMGEAVFQRIFDLGGTLHIARAREKFLHLAENPPVQVLRNAPDYLSFAHPLPLALHSLGLNVTTASGHPVSMTARLYAVGGLAVSVRVPVQCSCLDGLQSPDLPDLRLNGAVSDPVQAAEAVYRALEKDFQGLFDETFPDMVEAERYRVYCLIRVPGGAEALMQNERNRVAALLINDPCPDLLSKSNVDDITRNWFNYYTNDLVVADWDAALVVEPGGRYEDLLYVFEVANLELLLLRKYDLNLDRVLNTGYDEVEKLLKGNPFFERGARDILGRLSKVRMDLAEVTDELDNVAKFFGDYYLARVYVGLSGKLHVTDYHRNVDEKLATLSDLYRSIVDYLETRQNLILEWAIVLLIVFEIIMAFVRD